MFTRLCTNCVSCTICPRLRKRALVVAEPPSNRLQISQPEHLTARLSTVCPFAINTGESCFNILTASLSVRKGRRPNPKPNDPKSSDAAKPCGFGFFSSKKLGPLPCANAPPGVRDSGQKIESPPGTNPIHRVSGREDFCHSAFHKAFGRTTERKDLPIPSGDLRSFRPGSSPQRVNW